MTTILPGRRILLGAVLALLLGLFGAGCSNAPAKAGTATTASGGTTNATTARDKALRFAACMRATGVKAFPDPDASGELTIDQVANGSSLDTSSAAFERAIAACKDLEPAGFTGRRRTPEQQKVALQFAQCMRDNGVKDFPDPTPDGALIDTNRIPSAAGRGARDIPGFDAAAHKCGAVYGGRLGLKRQ